MGSEMCIRDSVWDGHDNAKRVAETGHGHHLHRNHWKPKELRATIESMLSNKAMQERLAATSAHMRSEHGPTKAAAILRGLLDDALLDTYRQALEG